MNTLKVLVGTAAFLAFAGPAAAVTVKNTSGGEITIGVDMGSKEEVKEIGAGKSVKFDCTDGCGVTGPWGYSWMAKTGDTIKTDGKPLVVVTE